MHARETIAPQRRAGFARRLLLLTLLSFVALGHSAGSARAAILPAVTIDGPSEEIVGFGGAAMAEDGTGGVVYLKRVEGVAHVFVARYVDGRWLTPVRVDGEDPYAASAPRIGAANGGQLVVIWATPFATVAGKPAQELLSATLSAGAESFGAPVILDPNIGEGADVSPALAMSSSGQAYVVYRVGQPIGTVSVQRSGDVAESIRVARYGGERWTRMGTVNRDPGVSMRPPSSANEPAVAVGPTGNGVVVWQEPEVGTGVARIWARRLFGSSLNYVMPVSATSYKGAPINEDADAPAVAFSRLGQAEVAYRQPAGRSSPLPGPRIFMNILSDGEAGSGSEFEGAVVADESVSGGRNASVGRPSIDVDERQSVRVLYDSNGTPRVVEGTDLGLKGSISLGQPFVGSTLVPASELQSASVVGPEGGGIAAWPSSDRRSVPGVAVREDYPEGGVQTGLVSGGAGGPIGELSVGRSGLGDGIVAFQQGPLGDAAIVASQITMTPGHFVITAPKGWIRPRQAHISWEEAPSANAPISYTVVLDGHALPTPAGSSSLAIDPRFLPSGIHQLQLLATDRYGQQTLTAPSKLRVDASGPHVSVRLTGRGSEVSVSVSDPQSGVASRSVSIVYGDGARAARRTRTRHRYARRGSYTIVVRATDQLGNTTVVRRTVRAR